MRFRKYASVSICSCTILGFSVNRYEGIFLAAEQTDANMKHLSFNCAFELYYFKYQRIYVSPLLNKNIVVLVIYGPIVLCYWI